MAVVLVATVTPAEGQLEKVEQVLRELIPDVHAEDGCEKYALHRAKDKLVFVEKWRDMEALGAHGSAPTIKAMGERLAGLTAGALDIVVLEPVVAGDPEKGAV